MAYFKTCPDCGAHLDPEETCETCRAKEKARLVERTNSNVPQPIYHKRQKNAIQNRGGYHDQNQQT